jgi:ribosomal protein S12 methylthiotransferase accessory factor
MDLEVYFEGNKKVSAKIGDHIIKTDQSTKGGGDGSAPEPFDLFLASIGTCAGIYVKGFCDQRGISTEGLSLKQSHHYNQEKRMIGKIEITLQYPADFPEKYKPALEKVINQCAVKKHLFDPPEFVVNV